MTQEQKVIRVKVGVLELAKQLGNVSQAYRVMAYSRDSFYRFKGSMRGVARRRCRRSRGVSRCSGIEWPPRSSRR